MPQQPVVRQLESTFKVDSWLSKDSQNQRSIKVARPKVVSCWTKTSVKAGSEYLYGDDSGLPTYTAPKLPVDLNKGYPASYIRKDDDEACPVEVVIQGAAQAQVAWADVQVCTFRNNLNKICLTPISPKNRWVIDACWFEGTLFLDIVKTQDEGGNYPDADRFTYYGYKFEAVCTGESDEVDATSEFALLLRIKLGNHGVIMAAEVDCARDNSGAGQQGASAADPLSKYLELKTFKLPHQPHQRARFLAQKYPRWWIQSFLAGIPTLVLGGRDQQGTLQEIQTLSVPKLPSEAAAAGQPFDAWRLLRFADDCLAWMSQHAQARAGEHLRFEFRPDTAAVHMCTVQHGTLMDRLKQVFPAAAAASLDQYQEPSSAATGMPNAAASEVCAGSNEDEEAGAAAKRARLA